VDWTYLAQDRGLIQETVSCEQGMNPRFPSNTESLLVNWGTTGFTRKTLLRGVKLQDVVERDRDRCVFYLTQLSVFKMSLVNCQNASEVKNSKSLLIFGRWLRIWHLILLIGSAVEDLGWVPICTVFTAFGF